MKTTYYLTNEGFGLWKKESHPILFLRVGWFLFTDRGWSQMREIRPPHLKTRITKEKAVGFIKLEEERMFLERL